MPDPIVIRYGGPDDTDALIALFDEAVDWLVERGQTGQWGTQHAASRPDGGDWFRQFARSGGLRIAEAGSGVVGALVIGPAPSYVAAADRPESYVQLLLTSRRHVGAGFGGVLVARARAEAERAGCEQLRVDCWAGAPSLIAWYKRQGFVRSATFELGGWGGQVLTMPLLAASFP